MIVELNGFICPNNIGNKAKSLVNLNRYGFKVPTSIAIDTKEYLNAIKIVKDKINLLLKKINFDNIEIISKQINILLEKVSLNEDLIKDIKSSLNDTDNYILRSSIDGVDTRYTYAGLFPTRMGINKNNIEENIIDSYKALFSYNSLYYMLKNNIDYSNIATAIIIQKEIKTDKLGFVMTMNPVTLDTNQLNLEIVEGKVHESYVYDYLSEKILKEDKYNLLTKKRVLETFELVNNIQTNLGYPVEIELAFTKNDIYVLQTRELTSILYDNQDGILKKINMSSKRFMWGLVNSSYIDLITQYYADLKIKCSNEQYCTLMFNHCYYNILNISDIVNEIIDYDDYYFFDSLKINNHISRKNKFSMFFKRFHNQRLHELKINEILEHHELLCDKYQQKYSEYCHKMSKVSAKDIENVWLRLVMEDYKEVCSSYLNLKLLILIEKNILFKKLKSYIEPSEFNSLIYCEEQMVEYKIKKEFNHLIKKIKDDEDSYRYWFSSSVNKILDNYSKEKSSYFHKEFRHFIDSYGYLSYYEMDLSESFYVEDVEDVIRDIKKQLANLEEIESNQAERENILLNLESLLKSKKYTNLFTLIERLQKLIIMLSEMKNFLLKFNFITKRYSKMLAKYYLTKKVIEKESDIWYLDIETIYNYTEGDFDSTIMKDRIEKSKLYYNSYRNFIGIDSLGTMHYELIDYDYEGMGYSTGIIEGNIKMVKSLKDLDTLSESDILVTKTINNNLLFQLPKIKGIIVSDSNLQSSVKDMIRELKIPCLMIDNCSKKLSDNMIVKADCMRGLIKILKD